MPSAVPWVRQGRGPSAAASGEAALAAPRGRSPGAGRYPRGQAGRCTPHAQAQRRAWALVRVLAWALVWARARARARALSKGKVLGQRCAKLSRRRRRHRARRCCRPSRRPRQRGAAAAGARAPGLWSARGAPRRPIHRRATCTSRAAPAMHTVRSMACAGRAHGVRMACTCRARAVYVPCACRARATRMRPGWALHVPVPVVHAWARAILHLAHAAVRLAQVDADGVCGQVAHEEETAAARKGGADERGPRGVEGLQVRARALAHASLELALPAVGRELEAWRRLGRHEGGEGTVHGRLAPLQQERAAAILGEEEVARRPGAAQRHERGHTGHHRQAARGRGGAAVGRARDAELDVAVSRQLGATDGYAVHARQSGRPAFGGFGGARARELLEACEQRGPSERRGGGGCDEGVGQQLRGSRAARRVLLEAARDERGEAIGEGLGPLEARRRPLGYPEDGAREGVDLEERRVELDLSCVHAHVPPFA